MAEYDEWDLLVPQNSFSEPRGILRPDVGSSHDTVVFPEFIGLTRVEFFPSKLKPLMHIACVFRVVVATQERSITLEVRCLSDIDFEFLFLWKREELLGC